MAGQRTAAGPQGQRARQESIEDIGRNAAIAFTRYILYGREQDYRDFRSVFSQQRDGRPLCQDERFMRAFCAGMYEQRRGIADFLDAYSPDALTLFGSRPSGFLLRSQTNDWLRLIEAVHGTDAAIRSGNTRAPGAGNPGLVRFLTERRARDSARIEGREAADALLRYVSGGKAADREAFVRLYEANSRPPERAERFRREAAAAFCIEASARPAVASSVYAFLRVNPARIQLIPPAMDPVSAFARRTEARLAEGDNLRSFAQAWSEVSDAMARKDERALAPLAARYGQDFVEAVQGRRRIAAVLGAVPEALAPRAAPSPPRRSRRRFSP